MLTRIDLAHFKCFEALSLPMRPLTLLTGRNGSGKSSVIQALLLLSQTMCEQEWATHVLLDGNTICLGTVSDVVDQVSGRNQIEVGVEISGCEIKWFLSGDRQDLSMSVDAIAIDDRLYGQLQVLKRLIPSEERDEIHAITERLRDLTYLTAERIGPREAYVLQDRHERRIGVKGELAASLLYHHSTMPVADSLALKEAPPTLYHQVQARMQSFFPRSGFELKRIPKTNSLILGFRSSPETEFFRPVNVGFGFTQVFPIIVASLAFAEDCILTIENPEVHLHPAGQALMGAFLGEVAMSGVQVIVETHSDHVLSGIRRAVRSGNVSPDSVGMHFFDDRIDGRPQVTSPQLDRQGNVDHWPEGFFDQFNKDASFLAGWGD